MISDCTDVLTVLREESPVLLPDIRLSSRITNDQWQWIKATEEDYQLVLAALVHYFSGQEIPSLNKLSDNRWLENWVIYYARLYELIQLCWKPLKNSSVVTRAREQLRLREDATPGLLLAFLLRSHFLAQIHECFLPYSGFCISQQRRFLENLNAYPEIKLQQSQELKVRSRKFLKDYGGFYSVLLATLKIASTQAHRSRQSSTLRKALVRFQDHIQDIRQTSLKRLRSRASYHWDKGDLHVGG